MRTSPGSRGRNAAPSDAGCAFRRRAADNPTRGERFPVFSWSPVQGAVSYDFHIEEEDGDKRDFTFRTTAASFKTLYGLGVFRWQVRANFPKLPFGTVPSAWSPVQTFTRFIEPPGNVSTTSDSNRVLLRWGPSLAAKDYRVDISETNTFNQVVDSHRTQNTNYAPRMNQLGFAAGGRFYWRVAALDEGQNVGGFAGGSFKLPRGMRVTVVGLIQKRKRGLVTVTVTTFNGKPVKRATVRASGAGTRLRARQDRAPRHAQDEDQAAPQRRAQVHGAQARLPARPRPRSPSTDAPRRVRQTSTRGWLGWPRSSWRPSPPPPSSRSPPRRSPTA